MLEAGTDAGCVSGWGSRASSADRSQLHAWLVMLTLPLTRPRGDTSWPTGAGCLMHMHMQAFTHIHVCTHTFTVYVSVRQHRPLYCVYFDLLLHFFFIGIAAIT